MARELQTQAFERREAGQQQQRGTRTMIEDALPSNVPDWLQKDFVSTCHEIPVANGRSHTVQDSFYSPRLVRWAIDQWCASIPDASDLTALQHTLQVVCADSRTFHAYLQVPEAFAEIYQEELGKQSEHRSELDSVKRVLDARSNSKLAGWAVLLGCTLFAAAAIVTVLLLR